MTTSTTTTTDAATLTHWTLVPVSVLDRLTQTYREATGAERRELLAAYRASGCCEALLVDADEVDDLDDETAPEAGPRVDQIDWAGFPG